MENNKNNFIHDFIDQDLANGVCQKIHTRFPPEPNGYLHIGHTKAIMISYETAKKYNGLFNLRFDDTNPEKEDDEYVQSIIQDLKWLGAEPNGGIYYGSDYFDQCYAYAVQLIKQGLAYVCDLSPEDMRTYRGTLTTPGKNSPYRERSVEENLSLFEQMKRGDFNDGERTLRAKIDMASPNINLRDPVIYRIVKTHHHRQKDKWCIYPMYDFAHPIQDAIEGITHSLCSIEFENHRPLYDWVVNHIDIQAKPRQIEFARLNMTYTVTSKRYLRHLVETGLVDGWDDPRMPTLSGLRRRGYTPEAIRDFLSRVGVSKADSLVDIELLEHCIREELNQSAKRKIVVIDPVKVIIDNYPEDKTEYFPVANNPQDPSAGTRDIPFTKEIYIDSVDFAEVPPAKFFRMKLGGEVRLMGAYIVKCESIEKDETGKITAIHCTADLETGNGNPSDGRKIKGTIHWVSAKYAVDIKVMHYNRLFTIPNLNDMEEGKEYSDYLNPESLIENTICKAEPSLLESGNEERFQFVRTGYYIKDTKYPNTYNRIVTLKDSYKPV
ncbi:MAG: glutamine--tRNA ligase/YqeY domain fusion protein [Clostridiales bacterium]|nr:glutamine--tRNA ligase/YqeY domain fusion protein [Clostridiales bacterium]